MNTNLSALVARYHQLREQHEYLVLASIIETMGSTYRKAGARMLITPDADFFGLLGGGCFEADLLAHAQEVFENRRNKVVFYDMRAPEDEIWGLGLGCNGAVKILLQAFASADPENPLVLMEQALLSRQTCVLFSVCESSHPDFPEGSNRLLQLDSAGNAELPGDWPEDIAGLVARSFQSGTSALLEQEVEGKTLSVFSSAIKPPFHLLLLGAGPDAIPIVNFARQLGWEITVVDYREAFLEQEQLAGVDALVRSTPEELADNVDLHRLDAIVLMTHKIEYDERYLKQLLPTSAAYIGLLGPAARRDRLLESLGDDVEHIRDRVFGPVGLDIGGELPEEIALSLIAQIQSVLYGRDATSLHNKTTPLHEEDDGSCQDLYTLVLAAGNASRFGGLKQLLEYGGTSLLRRCIDSAATITEDRIKVILGARAQKIKREIEQLDVGIVLNQRWEDGISSSIQSGIEALPDDCNAILLVLCDQALITGEHLQKLCSLWLEDRSRIVASKYADTIGAPVIIPRSYFPSIMKLRGDSGAKSVIEKNIDNVVSEDIPAAGTDIDTQSDYLSLLAEES